MADFEKAVERTLSHEGGFVDDPDDPGGATHWGISTRWLRSIGDVRDVRTLTREHAVELYLAHWWKPYRYGEIESQAIAERLFDLAINSHPAQAHKVLQRALRACGQTQVFDDGIIGAVTIRALLVVREELVLVGWRSEMAGFYRVLIALKPYRKKYKTGWLRRAYEDHQ